MKDSLAPSQQAFQRERIVLLPFSSPAKLKQRFFAQKYHHPPACGEAARRDHVGLEKPRTFLERSLWWENSISPFISGSANVLCCAYLDKWLGGEGGLGMLPPGSTGTHIRKRSGELTSAATTGCVSIGRPASHISRFQTICICAKCFRTFYGNTHSVHTSWSYPWQALRDPNVLESVSQIFRFPQDFD